jgi:hypothetical protein
MTFFSPLVVGLMLLARDVAAQASAPKVVRTPVMLGDTSITIVQEQYARWSGWSASDCAVPINMLNLHRNEETSIRAARQFFTQEPCGGQITFVDHGSASAPVRNVVFSLGGKSYNFDPNRVFTKRGREISLGATGAPEAAVGAYVNTLLSIYGWNSHRARHHAAQYRWFVRCQLVLCPARATPPRRAVSRAGRHVDAALSHAQQPRLTA